MTKTNNTSYIKKLGLYVAAFALVLPIFGVNSVSALQITARKLTLGTSQADALTTYAFNFTVPSATVIKSASFTVCTTASGACTIPSGFSVTTGGPVTLTSQPTNLGDASGWVVDTSTAGSLRLNKTGNVAAPTGSQTVSFSSVHNPSTTNATFFARITTYSDAAYTTAIDAGTVAASTAGQVTVTASVDETLSFTLANNTVALGTLSTSTTASGTSTMSASTNATSGYSIVVSGTTLTSGSNTITALASPTASAVNNKQFGINLMANTTPAVGSGVSGVGGGSVSTGYNTSNSFKFVSGDTVASASVPSNTNVYTVSHIANIDAVTAPGLYSTVLTYVATANF